MPPLSRAESQAATRARLIDAARELYLRDGYYATSNNQVAAHAGFSRGAVYSNFESKHALALVVLDEYFETEMTALRSAARSGPIPDRLEALERWALAGSANSSWAGLKAELAVASRGNDELRAELAARDDRATALIATEISRLGVEFGVDVELVRPASTARLLLAVAKGVGIDSVLYQGESATWISEVFAPIRAIAESFDGE